MRFLALVCAGLTALTLTACHPGGGAGNVDGDRIVNADKDPGNWLSHGRTYSEQRFSPLDKISTDNVGQMGLAWSYELFTNRGVEATPIVVDGTMYVTSAWSVVYALDAKTGALKWKYDPKVDKQVGFHACCDVVNRGVAVWKGRVYAGILDGRLVALDAGNGGVVWSIQTTDPKLPYTVTQAPRVVHGKVLIGNSGSEYGVRGYLSAYDADNGKLVWRFYTIPGDPSKGFESKAMESAAKTWRGEWWKYGGGGTVWDSMSFDPETNTLFFGTGNAVPWDQSVRSPGGGDNLYAASIVAVDVDTGAYKWHFQATPGDAWDYDSVQTLIQADLTINGAPRKVIMQASKNGYFYVLDRQTGKLISAKNYVPVTWTKGLDANGHPIDSIHYDKASAVVQPSAYGGHNWHPMAFSPASGLAYIPAQEMGGAFGHDAAFKYTPGQWNTAEDPLLNILPDDPKAQAGIRNGYRGELIAWDPVAQKEVWRAEHAGPWNGGILATSGNLVFQGTHDGHFAAYDAKTGKKVWSTDTYAATLAGPMTYMVGNEQYVAVAAGFGSVFYMGTGFALPEKGNPNNGRILVYKLGGKASLTKPNMVPVYFPKPPADAAAPGAVKTGAATFARFCAVCHGLNAIGAGVIPDLRMSPIIADADAFKSIVIGGQRQHKGMVSFAQVLKDTDAEMVRGYLVHQANLGYAQRP